jgi:hypothetical protein
VEVCGVPVRFIPHGKRDRILANLGLDAAGIAATVRASRLASLRRRAAKLAVVTGPHHDDLLLALELADLADAVTLPRFQALDCTWS